MPLEKDPRCFNSIVQAENGLQTIRLKAAQIQLASTILSQILPTTLLAHCFVSNIDQQKLVLGTDGAVWATQLRYQQQEILDKFRLNAKFASLQTIKIKICPTVEKTAVPQHQRLTLSSNVARLVKNTASAVTNPALKTALLKLAKNRAR